MFKLSPGLSKIIRNIGWLCSEKLLTLVMSLFITVYVIRYLGSEDFGKLGYALSFVELFSAFSKLGLDVIVVRNLVQEESATKQIIGTAFILKLLASMLTYWLIVVSSLVISKDTTLQHMTWIVAIGLIFSCFDVIDFWFQAKVKSGALVLARSIQLIISTIAKLLFIALHLSVMAFIWLLTIECVIKAIGMIWVYSREQSIFHWQFDVHKAVNLLRDSYPLILANMMVVIYMRIDQVMLGNMIGDVEVGNYTAALKFSEIWYFVPIIISSSVFPSVLRARQRSEREYYEKLQQLYDLVSWLAFMIAISMTILSNPLVDILFGQEYHKAAAILRWHVWAGLFVFLGVARSKWLMAENLGKYEFATTGLGAITNIALNCWLIPIYGGVGAAIATLISYALVSHFSSFLYPPIRHSGWMLCKALFIPFRWRQNIIYLRSVKQLLVGRI